MAELTASPPVGRVRSGYTTLTAATEEALRAAIQSGRFPPGSQLPPEMELISMLGVSRTTLREALSSLENQRLIVRRRGLGTYVSEQPILKDLSINFGITEMIRQSGMTPGTAEAIVRKEKPSPAAIQALKLDKDDQVVVVERVRTSNNRPVVWSQDILPVEILGEHVIEIEFLEDHSLYEFIQDQLNIEISHGIAQIRPISATTEIAAKLGVSKGTALLRVEQTDYTSDDTPVEFTIEHHLPDAFVFIVHRRGPHR